VSGAGLELHGITRRFGSFTALDNVSLAVEPGSVHALLGENGAGKTTLMRIAFGMIQPDAGSIAMDGIPRRFSTPADAIAAGIGMVHQQFSLVPAMTVAENVALGGKGRFRSGSVARLIEEIGERTGLVLDPRSLVGDLTNAERQKLEIIRTLAHDASVLILDEPTAVLTPRDTGELFGQLRAFASGGGSVVLITHKLDDALRHADEVTVLRRGQSVMEAATSQLDRATLTAAMLGTAQVSTSPRDTGYSQGPVIAKLNDVRLRRGHGAWGAPLNLEVRGGEILGVAALEGAAAPLLRLLAGRLVPESGKVDIPAHIGFIPENRQDEALIADFSLTQNFVLKGSGKKRGMIRWDEMRDATQEVVRIFDVRVSSVDAAAREMSGGNQQRFVIGRELVDNPPLLVLENPAQGLDVAAAEAVHARMRDARRHGTAVVFYSSDLDELAEVADRVLVAVRSGFVHSPPDRDIVGNLLLGAELGALNG